MIRIVDKQGQRMIGVINPSVNDFLKEFIANNPLELGDIKQHCSEYIQIKRLFPDSFAEFVSSGNAYSLNYASKREQYATILTCICKNSILSPSCNYIISTYINDLSEIKCEDSLSRNEILCYLLTPSMNSFYKVSDELNDTTLYNFFKSMDLDDYAELILLIQKCNVTFIIEDNEEYFLSGLNNAISSYYQNISGEDYYENYEISDIIDACLEYRDVLRYDCTGDFYVDQEYEINMSAAESLVFKWIKEDVVDEIQEKLKAIPAKYIPRIKWEPDKFDIDIHNLESYIESHLIQEPDYDYEPHSSSSESYIDSLDCIFDRF